MLVDLQFSVSVRFIFFLSMLVVLALILSFWADRERIIFAIQSDLRRRMIKTLLVVLMVGVGTMWWDYRTYTVYRKAIDTHQLQTASGSLFWSGRVGAREAFYIDDDGPFIVNSFPGRQYCSPELRNFDDGTEISFYYFNDCVLAWRERKLSDLDRHSSK